MKHQFVPIKNVRALRVAYEALRDAAQDMPKFGLIHGYPGVGKSTALTFLSVREGGIYIRATAAWTPSTMLNAILREFAREDLKGTNQVKLDEIIRLLQVTQKPLLIDEADYLFDGKRLLDYLRDIHDLAGVPVLLVGMEQIARKVNSRELLSSRVSQEIRFTPIDLEDARQITDSVCEVPVADDLLADLHSRAKGNTRRITIGLAQIEALGLGRGLNPVRLADWKALSRPYFLER